MSRLFNNTQKRNEFGIEKEDYHDSLAPTTPPPPTSYPKKERKRACVCVRERERRFSWEEASRHSDLAYRDVLNVVNGDRETPVASQPMTRDLIGSTCTSIANNRTRSPRRRYWRCPVPIFNRFPMLCTVTLSLSLSLSLSL